MISRSQRTINIAVAKLLMIVLAVIDELVVGIDVKNGRCTRFDCLFHVQNVGQHFPLHLDGSGGGARLGFGPGDDGGNRFSLVANLLV